jgi:N-methylhydantoinase A
VIYDTLSRNVTVVKIATTASNPEKAVLSVLQTLRGKDVKKKVGLINHATTIATNLLLTRSGLAKTALITNHGFRDVVEIGRQKRAELYNLRTQRPIPLVRRRDRFTLSGRILSDGTEIESLDEKELQCIARKIVDGRRFQSVAVGFLNSYMNNAHEKKVKSALVRAGFRGHVSLSNEVNPEYREFERISTAVVNSVLATPISIYLNNLEKDLKKNGFACPIYVMTSDGNSSTMLWASKYPISIIESGPAAGVIASAQLARNLHLRNVATFDMGGTTAKAGMLIDFIPDISYEFEAAGKTHSGRSIKGSGYPVRYPFIDIAEVSAGGGTIASIDEGGSLKLGPASAGADPGPAAYGKGGDQPTVTDANIVLGRLNPNHLLGGEMKLYPDLSRSVLKERIAKKLSINVEEAADSIVRIINHSMARAMSIVSIERARDPREFTLIAFGGAGPMHACELAEEIGIQKIIFPEHPGLFSAYGLLMTEIARIFSKPVLTTNLSFSHDFLTLEKSALRAFREEGFTKLQFQRFTDLRYKGQSFHLTLPWREGLDMKLEFGKHHKSLYGFSSTDVVEAVNIKVRASAVIPKLDMRKEPKKGAKQRTKPKETREVWHRGRYAPTPVYMFSNIVAGMSGRGGCIIEGYDSTILLNEAWKWEMDQFRNIHAENS